EFYLNQFPRGFSETNYNIRREPAEFKDNTNEASNIQIIQQQQKEKSFTKRRFGDNNTLQNESNNNWQGYEIDLLIQYISDNFNEYKKGNKTKLFNEMSANLLKNKEPAAIKSKLSRMIKTYSEVKKHNEQTGVERKDWEWFDKMDCIFGIRENISPSFITNRFTDTENEEPLNNESKPVKKLKKNNVDAIATAITMMSETRERVWDKKIELEKEKMAIELNKLE
ncbi:8339_t:CDS:2, partial [Funneliformis mosseae]